MNLAYFNDLLTKDVRWWICKCMDIILHDKTLINPHTHAMYLDIAMNHKDNMIPFLDAAIVVRCLEERIGEGKHYNQDFQDGNLQELLNLIHCINDHLDGIKMQMSPTVGKYSGDDTMIHHAYEEYYEARIFLCDPLKKGIRMKGEA